MPRLPLRVAFALFLGIAGSTLRAQEVSPVRALVVRQEVQAALGAYRAHAAAGRWDALLELYVDSPHFRWVESGRVIARSVGEIRKYLAALPAGTRIENTFEGLEITPVTPDVAEVVTRFTTRLVDPKGGGTSFSGAMTLTFVQHGDGWKILGGHASSADGRSEPAATGR